MHLTWKELTIDTEGLDVSHLLDAWRWLVDGAMQPMIITAAGDMFLRNLDGQVFWLNTIDGQLGLATESVAQFREQMTQSEFTEEWFMPGLVAQMLAAGVKLEPGQCYSFKQPPILGGSFEADNIEPCDLVVHFSMSGQIHEQIKDLPEGTSISDIRIVHEGEEE